MTATHFQSDVLVVGGGLAGLVTAIECLRAGKSVTLVDRDTPERLGGLALWAFGGMALVDTPLQRRMKLKDSPELALADWLRFGELGEDDVLPRQWASYYVEHSRAQVYDWVIEHGLKFMPAVNWVERGMQGDGNTLPRYHVVWGTSRQLTRRMIEVLQQAATGQRLNLRSWHQRGHGPRGAIQRAGGGAGHGRHQRQPRRNPCQLAQTSPPAGHHAQRRAPLCRWQAASLGGGLGRQHHPR
jgi:predicted oxidoreductase